MPGSLGFDAGHLLLEGVIEEHEWAVAVTILVGPCVGSGLPAVGIPAHVPGSIQAPFPLLQQ